MSRVPKQAEGSNEGWRSQGRQKGRARHPGPVPQPQPGSRAGRGLVGAAPLRLQTLDTTLGMGTGLGRVGLERASRQFLGSRRGSAGQDLGFGPSEGEARGFVWCCTGPALGTGWAGRGPAVLSLVQLCWPLPSVRVTVASPGAAQLGEGHLPPLSLPHKRCHSRVLVTPQLVKG